MVCTVFTNARHKNVVGMVVLVDRNMTSESWGTKNGKGKRNVARNWIHCLARLRRRARRASSISTATSSTRAPMIGGSPGGGWTGGSGVGLSSGTTLPRPDLRIWAARSLLKGVGLRERIFSVAGDGV